jgi:hypothetical protein
MAYADARGYMRRQKELERQRKREEKQARKEKRKAARIEQFPSNWPDAPEPVAGVARTLSRGVEVKNDGS